MSPEQYREKYGREPVLPETNTAPWSGPGAWPGWTAPWRPPSVVVVMAEYTDCFLWNRSPHRQLGVDDYALDPDLLGVTAGLTERLVAWSDRFDPGTVNDAWLDEGWSLARELQHEFDRRGLDVEIRFHDYGPDERAVRVGRRR